MWIELIRGLSSDCEFFDPATWSILDWAQSELHVTFPDDLRGLLLECNGVCGEYGPNLIWPLERIVSDNLDFRIRESFRDLYMPFNDLLFFGDAGNGDQFAFPIHANGQIERADIFAWNHEDDSRMWIAPSLKVFFEWWATGKIKV